MKILITGKNGQLGRSIHKKVTSKIDNNQSSDEFIFVGREELDLSSENNINLYFEINKFDIIVNCAAYTAVDKAEEEKDLASQINHLSLKQIAIIANKHQTKLIHISTDYVFDGESNKLYLETDSPNPVNFYGKTKLAGEKVIQELMPTDAIIIRVSSLYSEYDKNFVKTILRLGKEHDELSVVNDQISSPTYASDLASVILEIINNNNFQTKYRLTEIYHYSNKGEVSWYEFAKEIFKLKGIHRVVRPIKTEQYPTLAQRPKNTLMNKDKIVKKFNVKIPNWKSSLSSCIKLC
jgi:dTDP-4-dehydrorhamnose reductase